MLPFRCILCPTDFSEPATEGVKSASELALHFKARLLLVTIVPDIAVAGDIPGEFPVVPAYEPTAALESRRIEAGESMTALVNNLAPLGIDVVPVVAEGDPATRIVEIARDEEVDLIVIATHGRTGWRRLVFGSVAEKVLRHTECPVLAIREPAAAD